MHDELTDIRNQQYENAVRQLENLEMQMRAMEAYEQLRRNLLHGNGTRRNGSRGPRRGTQDTNGGNPLVA